MGFRGIKVGLLSMLIHPFETLEYILVPLLMSCAKTANELTAASLSRGLAIDAKRTCFQTVRFGFSDVILSTSAVVMIGMVILQRGAI